MSEQTATRVPLEAGVAEAALHKQDAHEVQLIHRSLSRASTHASELQRVPTYEANPYSIDRVNTRESFG